MLNEAEAIKINGQTITKTTVMNKVHSIEKELPEMEEPPKKKKACEYLISKRMRIISTVRNAKKNRAVLSVN